ncbi:UDP-glycosyltransferase UGT5-like isoform X2 [Diabrotica virgifera virgifera]|uniref:UDP-glucuronosyltransferase 2B15-like isoform X2 n=1 Tax=Diabrotica virgifera virgifera TaxID=50390 RepID=A0A6P7FZN4_DIAVI|nr:UDP-glycosyltransferase UGT5-like isoform X2 [Diabrotica virgifera virgifera]
MKVLLFILSIPTTFGSNILMIDEILSPSHQIWNYVLVEALLDKGHHVTLIGPKTIDVIVHSNFTMYELEDLHKAVEEIMDPNEIQQYGIYGNLKLLYEYTDNTCFHISKSPTIQKLIQENRNTRFDLIVIDMSLGGCLLPVIEKFNYPPSIAVCPFLLVPYLSELFGNSVHPAFVPHMYSKFTSKMSYFERIQNYVYTYGEIYLWSRIYKTRRTEIAKMAFGEDVAPIEKLERHLSLVLTNIIMGFNYARPLTPNIIPVGGLHIRPARKLPNDIEQIITRSKHGVILFGFGTNIRTSDLNADRVRAILKALSRLNETVLWKFDAHPKTKLFISHCGALSTNEAVYRGVPIVAVPFIVDQHLLAEQMRVQRWATVVDFKTITEQSFFDAIYDVLNNPEYRKNIQKLSRIVRDQKETPLERSIFWIEYAMRHNGTHHLNPESRDLSLFVQSSLDVQLSLLFIAFIFLVVTIIVPFNFKEMLFSYQGKKTYKIKSS